jgi:hypothetical protein
MCTLSFLPQGRWGYRLAMNRDESPLREPAERVQTRSGEGGVTVLYPEDGLAHGTWIAANSHGLTLALMNRATAPTAPAQADGAARRTRGEIILGLCEARDAGSAMVRARAIEPTRYLGFELIALDPEGPLFCLRGDGLSLYPRELAREPRQFVSTSIRYEEAVRTRGEQFAAAVRDWDRPDQALRELHRAHLPEKGPLSVCMHRPDARSVSLTEVWFLRGSRGMRYSLGSPCEQPPASQWAL